jgi:hypothetical protein
MADTVNSQLVETALLTGKTPERLFFEGTYKDLGIEVSPLHHRGPKETTLSRHGILSKTEKKNIEIIEAEDDAQIESLRRLFERLSTDAINVLETYQKDFPKQPSVTTSNHQKVIETDESRFLSAIESASNTLLQLYDSILAKHCPLTNPHAEIAIRQARGRERQNNKDFTPSATVLERYLRYLSSLSDESIYARFAESVVKNEGVSDIKKVIGLRKLLDCDFQNLARRLRSILEEAENALNTLKRRIETFKRIVELSHQRATARKQLDQSNSHAELETEQKAKNTSNATLPSRTTSPTQSRNRQFLHGSNRAAARLSADQMYSDPTQSARQSRPPAPPPHQNPREPLQQASAQASKSSGATTAKALPPAPRSGGIADLLNERQIRNGKRNSGHEI